MAHYQVGKDIIKNNIICIIPARGGSKGIPRKNIRKIGGKPLLHYTATAALESSFISRVVLTTDDDEIMELGVKLGLEVPFKRPANLATDMSPGLPVIQHAVKSIFKAETDYPDQIIVLQPTSPLRTAKHIDEAIHLFSRSNCDSLVSVTEVSHNQNPFSIMELTEKNLLKPFLKYDENKNIRQKKPVFYARNGAAIYICTYNCLMGKNSMFGEKIMPYFMKKEDSLDLDDEFDWELMEYLIEKKFRKNK